MTAGGVKVGKFSLSEATNVDACEMKRGESKSVWWVLAVVVSDGERSLNVLHRGVLWRRVRRGLRRLLVGLVLGRAVVVLPILFAVSAVLVSPADLRVVVVLPYSSEHAWSRKINSPWS